MSTDDDTKPQSAASYLTGAISSLSNWSSRANTPTPNDARSDVPIEGDAARLQQQRGRDHSVSHTHRVSWRRYPQDCPKLEVRWFHAVDSPKRKPSYGKQATNEKEPPPPKKWSTFSIKDSRSIEAAFQKLLEEEEEELDQANVVADDTTSAKIAEGRRKPRDDQGFGDSTVPPSQTSVKVPVNEDYLFDVEVRSRELSPVYWLGPIYDVRRGSWFHIEGSVLKPCDENLAAQLEEGFLKTRPWKGDTSSEDTNSEALQNKAVQGPDQTPTHNIAPKQPLTHRLFGKYINTIVTYQDSTTAWLRSDDFLSRMSSTVYERFAGGAHLSGTKVVRGYSELAKKKTKDGKQHASKISVENTDKIEAPPTKGHQSPTREAGEKKAEEDRDASSESRAETPRQTLERQMSTLVGTADMQQLDEETREREMREIRDEYKENPDEEQDREIDHLILCTHGIGQRLGVRFETFNFIQDVNALRKTMKSVYSSSPDLQALNSEVDKMPKNSKVQVIPVSWRHQLDFPMRGVKQNRKEHDIADLDAGEEDTYPTLEDITVDGVPALRTIISDLALDVLLYQTHAYNRHVAKIVLNECNRIFRLFKERNATFNGKVSLVGHSLGSAIMFDILCEQTSPGLHEQLVKAKPKAASDMSFDFDVDSFFCFGSPIGLFQMLNGRQIAGRGNPNLVTLDGFTDAVEDPFQDTDYNKSAPGRSPQSSAEALISSPKCKQMYNIFHPTDPISYRLEPLISSEMAALKPQQLPYTKKNFFGPMGQGITGIPAKVGQSVSGLWQGFRTGLADSFIQRSLGIPPEGTNMLESAYTTKTVNASSDREVMNLQNSFMQSAGAGTNITAGGVLSSETRTSMQSIIDTGEEKKRKIMEDTINTDPRAERQPTLIDNEMETLYAGFQKRRRSGQESDANLRDFGEYPAWQKADSRSRRLKREEAKVRALNANGRVDYSIQEGAFDISFLASIASHLTYWTDEDVCHFMMSQLLSRKRTARKSRSVERLR